MKRIMIAVLAAGLMGHCCLAEEVNLVGNSAFGEAIDGKPARYEMSGDVQYSYLGNANRDMTGKGVALVGGEDLNGDGKFGGAVSQSVSIDVKGGRWYRFSFRGLPKEWFKVPADGLFMRVDFSGDGGKVAYDGKRKELYPIVEQARKDLATNGNQNKGGAAVWREYVLNFYVPFPQVDSVKLTVGFDGNAGSVKKTASDDVQDHPQRGPMGGENNGGGPAGGGMGGGNGPINRRPFGQMRGPRGGGPGGGGPGMVRIDTAGDEFYVTDFSLTHINSEVDLARVSKEAGEVTAVKVIPIGGAWSYEPKVGETSLPAQFDHTNADRLLYKSSADVGYIKPFAGNMSAMLRAGDKDAAGNIVTTDRLIEDNVIIKFDPMSMIMITHAIPNHPTGKFPETGGGNPSYIQERLSTYYFPLNPKINDKHIATDLHGNNRALNMGPIGVAVNGVVFFNPFDGNMTDANNLMDRCCGHPNQDNQYHYHKYPVCINSPWADEGKEHSPLIGFAFDGFPIYGPYESADVMAKDLTDKNKLNDFNMHYDEARGWHYHVTPGKFPYIIGGYWGSADTRDTRHGPPGGGRNGGGRPGGFGPPDGADEGPPPGF